MPKRAKRDQALLKMLMFLVKFSILAIPIWFIIIFGLQLTVLKEVTAGLVFGLLKGLGIDAVLTGTTIAIPAADGSFAVNLNWVCIGWESMYIFFALVFATDFTIRKKIKGMIFLPVIYLINTARISSTLLVVKAFGSGYFDIMHIAWTFVLVAIILLLWWLWMRKVEIKSFKDENKKG